jgi:hypothetical protein
MNPSVDLLLKKEEKDIAFGLGIFEFKLFCRIQGECIGCQLVVATSPT